MSERVLLSYTMNACRSCRITALMWDLCNGISLEEVLHSANHSGSQPRREALEEPGLDVEVAELVGVSEVIAPERPWHSITIAFAGTVRGGVFAAENGHAYGTKTPRWFGQGELATLEYHPRQIIEKMIGTLVE